MQPNIVEVLDIFECDCTPIIITKYYPSGVLQSFQMEASSKAVLGSVMRQLLGALEFLHGRNFVHLGVTQGNKFVQNDSPISIALAGFEISTPISATISIMRGHEFPEAREDKIRARVSPSIWADTLRRANVLEERPRYPCDKALDI